MTNVLAAPKLPSFSVNDYIFNTCTYPRHTLAVFIFLHSIPIHDLDCTWALGWKGPIYNLIKKKNEKINIIYNNTA